MPFGFSNPFRQSSAPVQSLAAKDAITMLKDGNITLIDIRDHKEVAKTGKAKGAIHIPMFQLGQQADPKHPEFHKELSVEKPVALYCASGARSQMAGRALTGFGFTAVYNIGGFMHWQAAGGACTR